MVERILELGDQHETAFSEGLLPAERRRLAELLTKLAGARGLIPTVHPGF